MRFSLNEYSVEHDDPSKSPYIDMFRYHTQHIDRVNSCLDSLRRALRTIYQLDNRM